MVILDWKRSWWWPSCCYCVLKYPYPMIKSPAKVLIFSLVWTKLGEIGCSVLLTSYFGDAMPCPNVLVLPHSAVAQYPVKLSFAMSCSGTSRSAATPEQVAVLKRTNYLFANRASMFWYSLFLPLASFLLLRNCLGGMLFAGEISKFKFPNQHVKLPHALGFKPRAWTEAL